MSGLLEDGPAPGDWLIKLEKNGGAWAVEAAGECIGDGVPACREPLRDGLDKRSVDIARGRGERTC